MQQKYYYFITFIDGNSTDLCRQCIRVEPFDYNGTMVAFYSGYSNDYISIIAVYPSRDIKSIEKIIVDAFEPEEETSKK